MMINRTGQENISEYISGLGYTLLDWYMPKGKKNSRIVVLDKDGYTYDTSLNQIKTKAPQAFGVSNPFTIDNIKLWLVNNNKNFSLILKQSYKGNKSSLSFTCHDCNRIFQKDWTHVQRGQSCTFCKGQLIGYERSIAFLYPSISSEYNLKLNNNIPSESVLPNSGLQVWWSCNNCGEDYITSPAKRTGRNHGCPFCSGHKVGDLNRLSILFPEISSEWNKNKNPNLSPSDVSFGSRVKVWWTCSECGHEWNSTINSRTSGKGCPKCSLSKGEKAIFDFLSYSKIEYFSQYKFEGCFYKKPLKFDFYIPSLNACIEYHGVQHYEPVSHFGGELYFKVRVLRDRIKEEYCFKNNINLLIIPYWDYKNISDILKVYTENGR